MITLFINCLGPKDWVIILICLFFTVVWPFVLYFLKPKLEITSIEVKNMNGKCLAVKVVNTGYSNAVNLHFEICAIHKEYSYHFEVDKDDFIFLPRRKRVSSSHERVFKSYDIASFTKRHYHESFDDFLNLIQTNPEIIIRVRIHGNHSYSGFGKAFQKRFRYINGFQSIDKNVHA